MDYSYQEAVDYIEETPKFTTKNSLDHTRMCLRRLGDPQKTFRVIHVAGTNGKGSTCAFLASVMQEAGFRCGLFTSPHLVRINERFRVQQVDVEDETFRKAFVQVKALCDDLVKEGESHPTYFELLFLMGMLIFHWAGVDYVVLETGLGGRLDATTAIEDPVSCIISSISLDHMQYLGNTVEEIAMEKAGILVSHVPAIYDANDPEAARVIASRAELLGCQALPVRREDLEVSHRGLDGIDFSFRNGYDKAESFHIPFVAEYQVMNAALAVTAIRHLPESIPVSAQALKEGLRKASWPGRMEQILPGVVVDGAHNEDGVRKFVETARLLCQGKPVDLLFSAVSDKDYQDMIRQIVRQIPLERVVVTEVGGYRQVPVHKLEALFRESGRQAVEAIEDPAQAFASALAGRSQGGSSKEQRLLFCVGSLYLVGLIKNQLAGRGKG